MAADRHSFPPSISVVITTVGRTELRRALLSARNQTLPPAEIIVVDDSPDGSVAVETSAESDGTVKVVRSKGRGGGAARNLGVQRASGAAIAFLDDDDTWLPDKLEKQVDLWARVDDWPNTIVSCRTLLSRERRVVPATLIDPADTVAHYLFGYSFARLRGKGFIQTSSILCSKELAESCPFDERLKSHQDWDWLIRAQRAGASILMHPDVLYVYHQPAGGESAVSKAARPHDEQRWAAEVLGRSPEHYEYLMTVAAVRAVDTKDWSVLGGVLREAARQPGRKVEPLAFLLAETGRRAWKTRSP